MTSFLGWQTGSWFAVQVQERKTDSVECVLRGKGYETFVPRSLPRGTPGGQRSAKPLLPGYLFVRYSEDVVDPIVSTTGVIRVVGCGSRPEAVDAAQLEHLKRLCRTGVEADRVRVVASLPKGVEVVISEGPLSGIRGIVIDEKNHSLVVLPVATIGKGVAVRVPARVVSQVVETRRVYEKTDLASTVIARDRVA